MPCSIADYLSYLLDISYTADIKTVRCQVYIYVKWTK